MVHHFIKDVLKSSLSPVGKLVDYFFKVEFQHRGSPHIHMLMWIENAPTLGGNTNEEIGNFVDRYVTCTKVVNDENLQELVERQEHKHSRTCKKKKKNATFCRFHFPQPPMRDTAILDPLSGEDDEDDERKKHEKNYCDIKSYLNNMNAGNNISFDTFLEKLDITEVDYMKAIRSSLTDKKLFLKRAPSELRVNNYNSVLLRAWRANMDLQFILDPYACAMYIVSYISKAQRGMSNLLHKATNEARENPTDLPRQVRQIGNAFINHVEISAQEAIYFVLQMHLRQSSRTVLFVNTSPQRTELYF